MDPHYFGEFGGSFVPEPLVEPLHEIEAAFATIAQQPSFKDELTHYLTDYAGRPTPLWHAENISNQINRELYLKREDLLHGGAHKTNNTLGQGLLAKRMGKTRLIAETGAGQHGVATAMIGALLNLDVAIYMGAVDMQRQASNVKRMELFGAKVHPVTSGSQTLKDAINEALRDWIAHVDNTYYVFGSAAGPHPFPLIVRHFQQIIGEETREQIQKQLGALPYAIVACIGGGSNAIGMFHPFLNDETVKLYGAAAGGKGLSTPADDAAASTNKTGIFHGMRSLFLQDKEGQISDVHSIAAGLDYPGIGPEHAHLRKTGRVDYLDVADEDALAAFDLLAKSEGILGALESCHALALALRLAEDFPEQSAIVVNLSGRGDKDLDHVMTVGGVS